MPTQNSLDFSGYQIGKTKFIRHLNQPEINNGIVELENNHNQRQINSSFNKLVFNNSIKKQNQDKKNYDPYPVKLKGLMTLKEIKGI